MTTAIEPLEAPPVDAGEAAAGGEKPAKSFTEGFEFGELSSNLAVLMPIFCILLALIEGSSYIWRPIAVVLYTALIIFGAMMLLGNSSNEKYPTFIATDFAMTVLYVLAVTVGFSQVNRHMAILQGGFLAEQTGYWHWMRFGVANLLEAAIFDVPAIYAWHITEIEPTTMWSRTGVFIFRTLVEFGVVVSLIQSSREAWKFREKAKENPTANYLSFMLPKVGSLMVVAIWGLPIAIGVGAMVNDGLSLSATWSAIRLGGPVFLGAWIALHSLRGLGLSGWNKVMALGGIVLGVHIVLKFMPAFRLFLGQ